jgi:XTP/dITP diphosphohydrolase
MEEIMRPKLIVATGNRDKIKEIREILSGIKADVLTPDDLGLDFNVVEDGNSFEENAMIKARALHKLTGGYVMADDSGLSVNALNGAPGIYSARFAGEDADYPTKIAKIQKMLDESGSNDRGAAFICAVALIFPDGKEFIVRGECTGLIHDKIQGRNGFGYDPVFYVPEYGMTTASMTRSLKNMISHRGKAVRNALKILKAETDLFGSVDDKAFK